jgi:hypothetical protein
MRLISGIPPWVQMYYERLLARTANAVRDIFQTIRYLCTAASTSSRTAPNWRNSSAAVSIPWKPTPLRKVLSRFRTHFPPEGLLLNADAGMFFEFVPADEIFNENPTRLWLKDVELGVNYALILNTNAGLWGYNIGDTVQFLSKNPYRLVVSGRVKHFISAFGEHVIGKEVEEALLPVANAAGVRIVEFTVAPKVNAGRRRTAITTSGLSNSTTTRRSQRPLRWMWMPACARKISITTT